MTYTPTKQGIRQHYLELSETVSGSQEIAQGNVESFDRWYQGELRQAKEQVWDEVINAMKYEDGTPVELVTNINPYRSQE